MRWPRSSSRSVATSAGACSMASAVGNSQTASHRYRLRQVRPPRLVALRIVAETGGLELELFGNESEHRGRRLFALLQDPSREAQITERDGEAEAVRVSPPAIDQRQVLRAQRVVANHAVLVRCRRSKRESLRLAQEFPARHGCPF
jgi:hypothetical protein